MNSMSAEVFPGLVYQVHERRSLPGILLTSKNRDCYRLHRAFLWTAIIGGWDNIRGEEKNLPSSDYDQVILKKFNEIM
jgi:hypothetical protein